MPSLTKTIALYFRTETGQLNLWGKLLYVAVLFVLAQILIRVISKAARRAMRPVQRRGNPLHSRKTKTVARLLFSVVKFVLLSIWAMTSLGIFGVNMSAILATAGIGGVAIGFGAQTLVKDFIGGFFLILEDQLSIGDYVTIAGKDGIVEDIGLRTTRIRDFSGELHAIPNGEIRIVTNRSRNDQRAMVVFSVSYSADIDRAIDVLNTAIREALMGDDAVLEGPSVLGVTSLAESAVMITTIAQTKPMEHWRVERTMRTAGKRALDEAGIEIPYAKLDVHLMGERT